MNCYRKLLSYLVLIFSLVLCNKKNFAQDVEATFNLALNMEKQGNYETAIKLFQRVNYFDRGTFNTQCLLHIADSYFLNHDNPKAAEFYEYAYFSTNNDSIRNEIAISKAIIYLYEKKYLESLRELFSTDENKKNAVIRHVLAASDYYGLNKFDESLSELGQIINDSTVMNQIVQLMNKSKKLQKKNPKTAKTLSMIIPGLGQFYAGDIKSGLNSFIITSAFLFLTINTAVNYTVLEATSVMPWFSRYYNGGFTRAKSILINRVEDKQHQIFEEIIDLVEIQYPDFFLNNDAK